MGHRAAGADGDPAAAGLPASAAGLAASAPAPSAGSSTRQSRADMAAWTGCIAGALTDTEFRDALAAAGLQDVEIRETHRVHEHAAAAIIRARKPALR